VKPWIALVLVACSGGNPAPASASSPCAKAKPEGALDWIADDYPAALACAREKHVPVVVDLWAPWCHTCLSMQATVFADPKLADEKSRFVFVALDTDREVNAPALAKLSTSAWPTYYVVDSASEQVLARFVGAAGLDQFRGFLDAGARATSGGAAAADAHLLSAERALAVKDFASAGQEAAAALASAGDAWPRRREALNDQLIVTAKADPHGCVELGELHARDIGADAIATNYLERAWGCASKLPADDPEVAKLRPAALARWKEILGDAASPLSVDDRAEALGFLRDALDDTGDHDGARAAAEQARQLVDEAAAKAPTPLAAMTYNWPRAEVYAYLQRPLDLVPALEKSARDLPGEYDPRARLGWIYLKAGKLPEAAKWTDEALAMVYGPRKGRLLGQRAEIAESMASIDEAVNLRQQAVALYESLPASQQSAGALEQARQALAKILVVRRRL